MNKAILDLHPQQGIRRIKTPNAIGNIASVTLKQEGISARQLFTATAQ